MSISPISNVNFINQNAPVVSQTHANNQARFDLQNSMALQMAAEIKDEIAELRPAEETYKIDPEHQHEKHKNDQNEQKNAKNDEQNEQINDELNEQNVDEVYHLDIKI